MHELLDENKQRKARIYEKEKRTVGLISSGISLVFLLAFAVSGLSRKLAFFQENGPFFWSLLFYVFVFMLLLQLIELPFSCWSGYVLEHKWGFSNQKFFQWLGEQGKSFAAGYLLAVIISGLLIGIMSYFPDWWWLIAGLVTALFGVVMATLLPVVILPLFNTYTPIEDEKLKQPLEEILKKEGLKSRGFFREDMSRQTKKENAFLAGMGKTRRVVLGDNLMDNMSRSEITSIIAHEVGHYRFNHTGKFILLGTLQYLVVFFLADKIMQILFSGFPGSFRDNLALFPYLAAAAGIISTLIFGPLVQTLSRRFEKQADQYALKSTEDKHSFITAMAGLANRNLANAYPKKWIKILYYSHPPIGERLEMAEKYKSG